MTKWQLALQIGIILVAGLIAVEDFRTRMVRIFSLMGMTGLGLVAAFLDQSWEFVSFGLSLTIVLILLGSCFLILKWKKRGWESLGGADIWMLLLLPIFAKPLQLLWIIAGSSWGLLGLIALSRLSRNKIDPNRIPLAGGLAIGLIGYLSWKLLNYGFT